jgi:hypothetical protein
MKECDFYESAVERGHLHAPSLSGGYHEWTRHQCERHPGRRDRSRGANGAVRVTLQAGGSWASGSGDPTHGQGRCGVGSDGAREPRVL